MYRFLMRLKGSVHTKSHPEGSIMEWSMFTECLTLCSRYLHETQFIRQVRNDEGSITTPFFRSIGRGLAGKKHSQFRSQDVAASSQICFVQLWQHRTLLGVSYINPLTSDITF